MKYDYSTEEGRKEAIKDLNIACETALLKTGFNASPLIYVKVDKSRIEISIKETNSERIAKGWKTQFGSDIQLHAKDNGFFERENELSYGSSGAFTPEDQASYWRTIHAASALLNWSKVCAVVEEYTAKYKQLSVDIWKANRPAFS